MSLEKIQVVDRIEIVENGCVEIRTKTAIIEDGKQISALFHHHAVVLGNNYNQECEQVQKICSVVHTPEVVAAYQASLEQSEEQL